MTDTFFQMFDSLWLLLKLMFQVFTGFKITRSKLQITKATRTIEAFMEMETYILIGRLRSFIADRLASNVATLA